MTDQIKAKISILSQLANIDGEFDVRELAFLYNVCIRNDVQLDTIGDIISQPEPVISLEDLTREDQLNYLTDMLMLMTIDGKVLPAEVDFCIEIAERLNFDADAVALFIEELKSHSHVSDAYIRDRVLILPRRVQSKKQG